jgi:hypothetical protein
MNRELVRYEEADGSQIEGILLGPPEIEVREETGRWSWTVALRVEVSGEEVLLNYEGESATEQRAIAAARAQVAGLVRVGAASERCPCAGLKARGDRDGSS